MWNAGISCRTDRAAADDPQGFQFLSCGSVDCSFSLCDDVCVSVTIYKTNSPGQSQTSLTLSLTDSAHWHSDSALMCVCWLVQTHIKRKQIRRRRKRKKPVLPVQPSDNAAAIGRDPAGGGSQYLQQPQPLVRNA